MSPEFVRNRLALLQQVLLDLHRHVGESREQRARAHYEIERQVQLAVDLALGISRRILAIRGTPIPEGSRNVLGAMTHEGLLSADLARSLTGAVGMRNLLVHEYGEVDLDRFLSGLDTGYADLVAFCEAVGRFLDASR